MWLYLWPLYVDEKDNLVVSMVGCNWNAWDSKVALEVTLNILANADGKHTKLHEPTAGHDMFVLMAHIHKVSNCKYLHSVNFYKGVPIYLTSPVLYLSMPIVYFRHRDSLKKSQMTR